MSEKLTKILTPIVAFFFATALGVTAATTIGTDITTGGDLDVTGNSTLTGTLDVTGVTTLTDLSAIGTLTASTTAVGSDITLQAMDDMFLTTREGSIFLDANGATSDVELNADDDLLFYVGDQSGTGSNFQVYSEFFGVEVSNGTNWSYLQVSPSSINIATEAPGSDAYLYMTSSYVRVSDPLAIPALATLPTCSTTIAPSGTVSLAWDTTGPDLCVCNGSAWAPVDGSGTCE